MENSLQNRLNTYSQLSRSVKRRVLNIRDKCTLKKTLLVLPLVAMGTYLPHLSIGQGCNTSNMNVNPNGGAGGAPLLDINGGGNDFSFSAYQVNQGNAHDFFLKRLGNWSFAFNNNGGASYPEVAQLNGGTVGPGLNWTNGLNSFVRLIGGAYGTAGFNNFANWAPGDNGYIGIRRNLGGGNYNYGFIRVSIANPISSGSSVSVDITMTGLAAHTDPVTVGNCSTLLPVELTSFKSSILSDRINLLWQTASELNNSGFEVQRSIDGKTFKTLAFIEGRGTTNETQDYYYDDKDLRRGQLYHYRLKQIDYDGAFEYSKIITARLDQEGIAATFSPNPAVSGETQLAYLAPFTGEMEMQIYDVAGKELLHQRYEVQKGDNQLVLDLSRLVKGLFFVKLEQGEERVYEQIVVE